MSMGIRYMYAMLMKSIRHYSISYIDHVMCLSTYCVRSSSILNSAPGTKTTLGTGIQGAPAPNPLENAICANKKHCMIYTTLNPELIFSHRTKISLTKNNHKQISNYTGCIQKRQHNFISLLPCLWCREKVQRWAGPIHGSRSSVCGWVASSVLHLCTVNN